MKAQDKIAQQKANSSAHTVSSKAIQKKAVGVVQKVETEEDVQQHKPEGTVQKMDTPELDEEHPAGTVQHKINTHGEAGIESVQLQENKTGMPDQLKSGIESLSGMSMDHVKVHYNSSQPAQLNALAYAQGSDIHIAPGQEQHLPHEAWHVVQQAQGRVQPTTQMKAGVPVNDDPGLEHEADVMGEKALSTGGLPLQKKRIVQNSNAPYQFRKDKRVEYSATRHYNDGWGAAYGIQDDNTLKGRVSDDVKGSGEIGLGNFVVKTWKFQGYDYRNLKKANILYKDESEGVKKYRTTYTSIYHCGPTGGSWRQYHDGTKWVNG